MAAKLEHANISVSDAEKTAAWMQSLFGWHIRWQGVVRDGAGLSIHVGDADHYLALYTDRAVAPSRESSYKAVGGLNHLAVVVDDLDTMEAKVRAAGFTPINHADYEPGRRFYFHDADDIEYEVVSYT